MTDETLDTFDNGDYTETQPSGLDTFDEGVYTDGPEDSADVQDQEQESDKEDGQKSTEKPEDFDEDSQVNQLDEKEEEKGKDDEKESDKGDEETKSGDKESTDDKPDENSTPDEDARPAGKVIKAFQDGKAYNVPQEAQIRVKVDGKNEKVPVQELINNYSGKVSWDKKFSELSEEKNHYKAERDQYDQEKTIIQQQLATSRELAVKSLNGEARPLDFVNNVLDQMNINSYDFHKALRESMAEELSYYNEMTEIEREAYELKQRNEYLEQKQETSTKSSQEQKAQEELIQRVDSLRQTHGVSEEQYVAAFNDLSDMGIEDLSAENVVKYAVMVEPTAKAESLVEPYLDQLSDDEADALIVDIAKQLQRNKSLTTEEVAKFLAEEYEVEDIVSDLKDKVGKEANSNNFQYGKQRVTEDSGLESFDDFD